MCRICILFVSAYTENFRDLQLNFGLCFKKLFNNDQDRYMMIIYDKTVAGHERQKIVQIMVQSRR